MHNGKNNYEGEFKNGKKSNGQQTLPNGDIWIGPFLNDKPHGAGTLKTKNAGEREVEFRDGAYKRDIN